MPQRRTHTFAFTLPARLFRPLVSRASLAAVALLLPALTASAALRPETHSQTDRSAIRSAHDQTRTADALLAIDPLTQQAYLKASNTEMLDFFGSALDLDGDTLVVGAPLEDSAATGPGGDQADNGADAAGAVYVFVRSGGEWVQQAYLKASNADADDRFGIAVAISGDTIVVGALGEDSAASGVGGDEGDDSAPSSGAVYVFVRSGSIWTQQAYLKASTPGTGDHFGEAVAIDGDRLIVGAPYEDSASSGVNGDESNNTISGAGAAYLFERQGGSWTQHAYLKASNPAASSAFVVPRFGFSVAVSGDIVVVGAPGENGASTGVNGDDQAFGPNASGAAYIFVPDGATWAQEAYVKASNTGGGDQFGTSVSVSGETVAIGSPGEESSATGIDGDQSNNVINNAGAAYVFVRTAGAWAQEAYVKASDTQGASPEGDAFGICVDICGNTLAVGAFWEDGSSSGINGDDSDNAADLAGAAYVFGRLGATWSQRAYVKPSNTDSWDQFAWRVAVSGTTLAVSTATEDSADTGVNGDQLDNSAEGAGAVYVYVLNDCNGNGTPDEDDIALGTSFDLDGDGIPDECPAPCDADLNGDGIVNGADLGALLAQWGGPGAADLDSSGVIDAGDVGILLAAWGSCG